MPDMLPISHRGDLYCAVALLLLWVALWTPRLGGPIDLRYDAGVYYILGTSLAEGKGYRLLNEPGEISGIQYPPALPALVAVHQLALGTDDPAVVGRWLRWTFAGITLGYMISIYLLARVYLAPLLSLLAAGVSSLYLHTYFLSDLLFTEVPFGLVTCAFLVIAMRWRGGGSLAACAVLGAVAFLLRSAGAALLIAWVGQSLLEKRWREAAARTVLAALPILGWQLHIASVKSSPEYLEPAYAYQRAPYMYYNVTYFDNLRLVDSFAPEQGVATTGQIAGRVLTNAFWMPLSFGEAVSTIRPFWEWPLRRIRVYIRRAHFQLTHEYHEETAEHVERDTLLARTAGPPLAFTRDNLLRLAGVPIALLSAAVVGGLLLWIVRRQWLMLLYIAGSLGLICLTPWPGQFPRYLTPLTPVLVIALFLFLAWLMQRCRETTSPRWNTAGKAFVIAVISLVVLAQLYTADKTLRKGRGEALAYDRQGNPIKYQLFYYDSQWRAFEQATHWIAANTAPTARIASACPHLIYLQANRIAVMSPMEIDPAEALRKLDSVPADYLVVDTLEFAWLSQRYAKPMVEAFPDEWELVFQRRGVLEHSDDKEEKTFVEIYRRR